MSDSKQNEHKKARVQREDAELSNQGTEHTGVPKDQKDQQNKPVRAGLNPQEDGDENICPDDKSDIEPDSGSVCEFQ